MADRIEETGNAFGADWPGEPVAPDPRDRAALASIRAGRFISQDAVEQWLESWGRPDELPPPRCGA